jgi:hypothetical protein
MSSIRIFESDVRKSDLVRVLQTAVDEAGAVITQYLVNIRPLKGAVSTKFVVKNSAKDVLARMSAPATKAQLATMPAGTVFALSADDLELIQYGQARGRFYAFPRTDGADIAKVTDKHAAFIAEQIALAESEDASAV